jgi:Uma2 family endonuclease
MTTTIVAKKRAMTAAEYLKMEREGIREMDGKYEFFNNQLRLILAETPNHNRINRNVVQALTNQIDASDRDLELFFVDVRVVSYLSYKDYLYPDTFIVEGKPYFDDEQNDNLVNPRVIVEVLSKSTESFDRGDKFKSYRQIPTLQEYILVNQKHACIEQFYRDETGKWIFGDVIYEGVFKLKSLPFELDVKQVYRKINFSATDENED